MRPDGFGGAVTVITRENILAENTKDVEGRLIAQGQHGAMGCRLGAGEHLVLTLPEQSVRDMVDAIGRSANGGGKPAVTVTDGDIRQGCGEAILGTALEGYRLNLTFNAAQAATRIAAARSA